MTDEGDLPAKIRNLLKVSPRGHTISEISQRLRCNRNSVAKYLEILQIAGTVEMQQMGAAKVYYISQRVPLSNLIGFTKEGIIVISSDGRILQINERFCKMFDLDQASCSGMPFQKLSEEIKKAFLFENYLTLNSESEQTVVIPFNTYDWKRYFKVKYIKTVFEDGRTGLTIFVEDVTLEKEMGEQLKLNEARFRGIVEDQTELICRFTRDGFISFVNGAFLRVFKMTPLLSSDQSFFNLFPEEMTEFIQKKIEECSSVNPVFQIESEIILPVDQLKWFHWIIRALTGENNEIIEFQAVGRDITTRKNAEREILIKSQAIDSSILPILLTDLEGKIKYTNTSFLKLWGYSENEDLTGLSLEQFIIVPLSNIVSTQFEHGSSKSEGYLGNVKGTRIDGTTIHLSVTISTVYDEHKIPVCLIVYFYDITEQVRMIKELEIKNTAIAKSYEGMGIISPEGVLTYANPSFLRIFSRVPDRTMVGKRFESCLNDYPNIRSSLPDIEGALKSRGIYTQIFSDIEENGMKWTIQVHLSRTYDNQSRHICTLISALDITEQKAIEESLAMTINQLEGTVEQIRDPTFIISRDRIIVAWNRAMESFSGIRKETMIGSSRYKEIITDKIPALPILVDLFNISSKELIQSYPEVSKVGNTYYTEVFISSINDNNGTYLWVRASPIMDASGKAIGIIQTMKDMTNWKRAAESIIERPGVVKGNSY